MRSSSQIRKIAWESLRGRYWDCFAVTVILVVISGVVSGISAIGEEYPALSFLYLMLSIFVLIPLGVGYNRFYIKSAYEKTDITEVFIHFKLGYMNVIKISIIAGVKILLWSMLLIIPGIIKSFEYAMIPFILAENPEIETNEAFRLSKMMMDGNKFRYFCLGLSFIGWILLGILSCGIGIVFLDPYMMAAYTQFYFEVKESIEGCTTDVQNEG